jgi:hypothetical protein
VPGCMCVNAHAHSAPLSPVDAARHYQLAAQRAHADAHAALGYVYAVGDGVEQRCGEMCMFVVWRVTCAPTHSDALSLLHYEMAALGDSFSALAGAACAIKHLSSLFALPARLSTSHTQHSAIVICTGVASTRIVTERCCCMTARPNVSWTR